jgi:hypothetical protein
MTVVPPRLPVGDMPASVPNCDSHLRVEFNPKPAKAFAIPVSTEIGMGSGFSLIKGHLAETSDGKK